MNKKLQKFEIFFGEVSFPCDALNIRQQNCCMQYTRARSCLALMGRDFTGCKTVVKLSHQTTYKTGSKWALNV